MKTTQVKLLALMLTLSGAGWWSASSSARADQKSDLVQIIRQKNNQRQSIAVDKLMTFNLSPGWWQYFLNRDTEGWHMASSMADSLMTFGKNTGYGDIESLDQSQDASSPLVIDAIDKLQDKAHCTIELTSDVKEDTRAKIIDNIALFENPITEKYYCKPRGGKLHVTITLDLKATALKCQVSKDGNDYHFTLPAYIDLSSSPIEEFLKQGT